MQVKNIISGSEEKLRNKEYIIGVGISLGNKFFSLENILEYINFSLIYSKSNVIVYVADSIHSYNIEVRSRVSRQKSLDIAVMKGKELLKMVEIACESYNFEEKSRIKFVSWTEIEDKEDYKMMMDFVFKYYESNLDFKRELQYITRSLVSKEARFFDYDDIETFNKYFLSELPELLTRVKIGKYNCDAFVCPYESDFTKLSACIQNGIKYHELQLNIVDKFLPKVCIILN